MDTNLLPRMPAALSDQFHDVSTSIFSGWSEGHDTEAENGSSGNNDYFTPQVPHSSNGEYAAAKISSQGQFSDKQDEEYRKAMHEEDDEYPANKYEDDDDGPEYEEDFDAPVATIQSTTGHGVTGSEYRTRDEVSDRKLPPVLPSISKADQAKLTPDVVSPRFSVSKASNAPHSSQIPTNSSETKGDAKTPSPTTKIPHTAESGRQPVQTKAGTTKPKSSEVTTPSQTVLRKVEKRSVSVETKIQQIYQFVRYKLKDFLAPALTALKTSHSDEVGTAVICNHCSAKHSHVSCDIFPFVFSDGIVHS